jgi:hypothetical protein
MQPVAGLHLFVLRRVGDSSYRADGIVVSKGNWYLDAGTKDWRHTKGFGCTKHRRSATNA